MLLQMASFHSLLWLTSMPLLGIYTHTVFSYPSSADGRLGGFRASGAVSRAAVNPGGHSSFWITVFSRDMPRNGIAGSEGSSYFQFFKDPPYCSLDVPDSSVGKESACNAGDPASIPGSGRSAGEGIGYPLQCTWASLVAQLVKNPPAMWKTWVQSLGWEDRLEKGKATHSSIPAWRSPWMV